MRRLLLRYPIIMAILFAIFSIFMLYGGFEEERSINALAQNAEKLSMAEIGQRMNQGSNGLNVQLIDGKIDCASLSYLEVTYALLIKEYTADVLITSNDNSLVLFSFFKGTPSCEEIASKPVVGIITKMEEAAQAGMVKTNLMGIRKYPNASIFRFCGGCTINSKTLNKYMYFGASAFCFLAFLFSLYLQEKKWSAAEKAKSLP